MGSKRGAAPEVREGTDEPQSTHRGEGRAKDGQQGGRAPRRAAPMPIPHQQVNPDSTNPDPHGTESEQEEPPSTHASTSAKGTTHRVQQWRAANRTPPGTLPSTQSIETHARGEGKVPLSQDAQSPGPPTARLPGPHHPQRPPGWEAWKPIGVKQGVHMAVLCSG